MSQKTKNVNGYYNEKVIEKFTSATRDAMDRVRAGEEIHIHISNGNRKMGDVPSISLVPFLSCPGICKDTCGAKCYAAKIANLRPNVLKNYAENQALAILKPAQYWKELKFALAGYRFFRFHVSGDIFSKVYFENMIDAARENPHCEMLAFTKKFNIVNAWIDENGDLPENLHIIFSAWENLNPENPHCLPESLAIDFSKSNLTVDTLPENYKTCGGNCFNCACRGLGCWQLNSGETVVFEMH